MRLLSLLLPLLLGGCLSFSSSNPSTTFEHHCCRAAGYQGGVPHWFAAALLINLPARPAPPRSATPVP